MHNDYLQRAGVERPFRKPTRIMLLLGFIALVIVIVIPYMILGEAVMWIVRKS